MDAIGLPDKSGAGGQGLPASLSDPISASDLPLDEQGRIYHLQIKPDQLAPDILIVGDPGRAEMIGSTFLHDIEVEHEHRGLVTITGISAVSGEPATILSPIKTTVTTSGMGTPSLEIILQELVALNEIDFTTRLPKRRFPRLQIIRVGTSGALQASTRLGTLIITSYAIGMDNTGLYYEVPYPDETCLQTGKGCPPAGKKVHGARITQLWQDPSVCLACRTESGQCPDGSSSKARSRGQNWADGFLRRLLRPPGP